MNGILSLLEYGPPKVLYHLFDDLYLVFCNDNSMHWTLDNAGIPHQRTDNLFKLVLEHLHL